MQNVIILYMHACAETTCTYDERAKQHPRDVGPFLTLFLQFGIGEAEAPTSCVSREMHAR